MSAGLHRRNMLDGFPVFQFMKLSAKGKKVGKVELNVGGGGVPSW